MRCWIGMRLLGWIGLRTQESARHGDERKPKAADGRSGTTEVGWLRLLGAVAASRGDRRTVL